jgi:RHS repeat-associated protein
LGDIVGEVSHKMQVKVAIGSLAIVEEGNCPDITTPRGEVRTDVWGVDLSGTTHGAGGVGGLVATVIHNGPGAGVYFPAYDGNGNVMGYVWASDGVMVAPYEYGPFGELLRATGPLAQTFNHLFSTKSHDWETGLYYYGHRYYHPHTGRWPNRDPIEENGGVNLYGFLLNDPCSFIDADGRELGYTYVNGSIDTTEWPFPQVNDKDNDIQVPAAVDGLLKKALEATMSFCFWRCYLLDLSDNDVQRMLDDIQNSVSLDERAFFQAYIAGIPGNVGNKFVTLAVNIHNITARIPQGEGISGAVIHKATPRVATIRLVRRKIYQLSVSAVGKNGVKYFGRFGSKVLPYVAIASYAYEAVKICQCKEACRDDVFSDEEKIIGQ